MKTQPPTEPKPEPEYQPIDDSHGPWANGWHPAWDSATEPSNSGAEVQENSPDHSLATKSPGIASTPHEEQRD